ncbi:MarR family transcriptional regulator [Halobacillus rhizosphaerae]|uniref:MarR family winged helix-turn-helix transcriptional regulator n=1 Tax=Halobacillus rhizosphaerae TaxID=3064889 RepID=UPI00398A8230
MSMKNEDNLPRGIQLLRGFSRLNKNIAQFVQKTASMNNLSVPQYTILITLSLEKEMTQKLVGKKTFLPKSTLSQSVDGLVQAGLLHRKQVEDNRREVQLSLSEQGLELLSRIHLQEGSIHQITNSAADLFSETQFKEFLSSLQQLSIFFEEQTSEQGDDHT